MKKERKCLECGQNIPATIKINGKRKSLWSRKLCLDCSPYRGDKCKSKICKNCGKDFPLSIKINNEHRYLVKRSYCLECIPYNSGISGDSKFNPLNQPTPRECRFCGKTFIYQKRKGHRRFVCNSCKSVGFAISKKKRAIEHKGGKCVECGYDKYYGALEFHHIDPTKKDFQISTNLSRAWEKLKKELDKCILVCSNCHRELHANIREYTHVETMKNGRNYKRKKRS